jgi:hypothetical protein
MFQRGITALDVHLVLQWGETIEEYADDRPYPAKLVLGWSGSRPLHVVVAENIDSGETVVITVYEPDPEQWNADYRRKRP